MQKLYKIYLGYSKMSIKPVQRQYLSNTADVSIPVLRNSQLAQERGPIWGHSGHLVRIGS